MGSFVKAQWVGVAITALAVSFCVPSSNALADGIKAGLGVSIGGAGGINAGAGVSLGGPSGVGAGLGASVGGKSGVNAGGGAKIGGSSGVAGGLGASMGGKNGVNTGGGATIGGSGGVTAGLGAIIGDGVKAGASANVGDGVGLDAGVSIGGVGNTTVTTDRPRVVVDRWRDPTRKTTGGTSTTSGLSAASLSATYGMSAVDLVRFKKRCVDILGNASGYDRDLVSLCRAIRGI